MNTLNPNAINLWLVGASVGYVFGHEVGLALGLATSGAITLLINVFSK